MIRHLTGLSDVAEKYDYFLLDIFGLMHNGVQVFEDTIPCLEALRDANKKICFISNTPRRADGAMADLARHGIDQGFYDALVTAGESARTELIEKYKGKRVFFLGNEHFAAPLENLDILQVKNLEQADFILNSIPGTYDLAESELAALLHDAKIQGLKMVCANPDLVVHIGDTLYTCAGTYAVLYEHIGGEVSYHGKPYPHIYDMALDLLGNPDKSRVCAIGDALHTDVRGANNFGIDSIWALSGIHWEELQYDHNPGTPDPARVTETLGKSPHKPTATITRFKW